MADRQGRTAVLISGRGSNLGALIAATTRARSTAAIGLVVADRVEAAGLAFAHAAGIPAVVIDRGRHVGRDSFEHELNTLLQAHDIEWVCLAGFMRILGPRLVERWRDRMLNIHPSLLPAFPGLDTHRRALAAGVRFTGCTVHVVRAEVDRGPIVAQGVVPVHADDTETTLAARVLGIEHRCYPLALELFASGRARVEDERVVIDAMNSPPIMAINPADGPGGDI